MLTFRTVKNLLTISSFASFAVWAAQENILIVDSNFPSVKNGGVDLRPKDCPLVTESPIEIPDRGPCVSDEDWSTLKSVEEDLLRGLQDTLAKVETPLASKWKTFEAANKDAAKKIKSIYTLSVHGARSAFVAVKSSGGKAKVLPLRVTSAQAGVHTQANSAPQKSLAQLASKKYTDGCSLVNWAADDMTQFDTKGQLLPYLDRLAAILDKNPSIKVINISLGYKLSYIVEDNPGCSAEKSEKDFKVLQQAWRNLFRRFSNRLFLVAAGNEGQDLGTPENLKDDLWASLASEANLLVVGSLNSQGERLPSSNYGSPVHIMAPGENLEVHSPLPKSIAGHATTVRGTSFSTPLVAGRAVKLIAEKPSLSVEKLRQELIAFFSKKKN